LRPGRFCEASLNVAKRFCEASLNVAKRFCEALLSVAYHLMKIKQLPEDFEVEELTDAVPAAVGPYAFYRMEKRGWSTLDALAAIRRRWKIDLRRLSYGGLKDRHGHTIQYFTILHGPERNLTHHAVAVRHLGRLAEPYTSRDIRSNRFQITLRGLNDAEVPVLQQAVEEIRRDGLPNYFDDQRFGSVGGAGEFVARLLVRGQFEEALRLALAGEYEHDRAEQKREKAVLRRLWGNWPGCKEQLPKGHARSLVDYLVHHPGDFRGAVARLRPELRGLYLSAYQSHLWNRMLARWLVQHCRPEQLLPVHLRLGNVPFPRRLDPEQLAGLAPLQLPLPSARTKLAADDPRWPLVDSVLAEEGLVLSQLQVKGIRELFFSKGERAALCRPAGLSCELQPDEVNKGREKAILAFDLPRGSYATLIVKRIQAAAQEDEAPAL
jgi:tRNA pseudouridine13 synthase